MFGGDFKAGICLYMSPGNGCKMLVLGRLLDPTLYPRRHASVPACSRSSTFTAVVAGSYDTYRSSFASSPARVVDTFFFLSKCDRYLFCRIRRDLLL